MDKQSLIREILQQANAEHSDAISERIVNPLRRFGTVWFADGQWWFTEEVSELATYTANGTSISRFGEGQFEVKRPTPEQVQEAIDKWNSGHGRLK